MKMLAPLAIPLLVLLLGVAACSGEGEAGSSTSVAPLASATPAVSPNTAPLPSGHGVSVEQLMDVGSRTFPYVSNFGYYAVCGQDGDTSTCPYTEQLRARLAEVQATLCRCQNPSTTLAMSAEVTDFGGVLYVALHGGSQSFTLTVVEAEGRLLIDDQVCMGGGPETSIHRVVEPCR